MTKTDLKHISPSTRLKQPKSLCQVELPSNLYFCDLPWWSWVGQKFKDTFNTKWRLLDNFSTDNVLRQSKHFTGLLFIFFFCICINCGSPITSNLVLLSIQASLTFSNNLYLLIYFKKTRVLWLFSTITTKMFPVISSLISNFLLSNYHLHVLCSFREAGPFTSPISEFCPIIIKNFNSFFWSLQKQQTWSVYDVPGTMVGLSHKPSHLIL